MRTTHRPRLAVLTAVAIATVVAPAAAVPMSTAFRGSGHAGARRGVVTFRVAGGKVVDFQLDGFDVQEMRLTGDGRFAGCNPRAAGDPCVRGTVRFARGSGSATGTAVDPGRHHWRWNAVALGTVRGG